MVLPYLCVNSLIRYAKGYNNSYTHKGPEQIALHRCDGGQIFGGDHARVNIPVVSSFIGSQPGTDGDTGLHFNKRNGNNKGDNDYGAKTLKGWPRWDTVAHQQAWEGHLKQAWRGGMSVYFMSAVDFHMLCKIMPVANRRKGQGCGGMQNIDLQINAAWEFVEERDWVDIATSPQELRDIVGKGKLAVVLAIEISDLFSIEGCKANCTWEQQLDKYYDWGVRSIQIVHELNNQFGGAALHHWMFKFFQLIDQKYPFKTDSKGRNMVGLTSTGKKLIQAFIDRGMFVDIAHLSERGVESVYEISKNNSYYPIMISHALLRSLCLPDKQKETKTTPDWIIKVVRETGGIIGLRTHHIAFQTYKGSGVKNDCDGSSKTFAQAYQYGVLGVNASITFGSDLNGFIQQMRPRFGNTRETCGSSGKKSIRTDQQKKQLNSTRLGTPFDYTGLGHIGLLPDIISELREVLNVDTSRIESSTEIFAKMWERMYDNYRTGPLSLSGFNPLQKDSVSPNGYIHAY
eukprot:TRINITY_DN1034_c0_g1_i1.p1 TRINITY_DN1034_c0_g1~~TRINITY_DN1034_c0_g1_i1.p1  ORF type:complete len:515 (-),score=107.21 TRINITY_DN1034_c0_g1_i1:15-1559(-)